MALGKNQVGAMVNGGIRLRRIHKEVGNSETGLSARRGDVGDIFVKLVNGRTCGKTDQSCVVAVKVSRTCIVLGSP